MFDLIKHQIIDDTAFLKRLLVQVCKHSRDTTFAGVVIMLSLFSKGKQVKERIKLFYELVHGSSLSTGKV